MTTAGQSHDIVQGAVDPALGAPRHHQEDQRWWVNYIIIIIFIFIIICKRDRGPGEWGPPSKERIDHLQYVKAADDKILRLFMSM